MNLEILNRFAKQQISNKGYEDGLNGVTPYRSFNTEEAQDIYDKAYDKGQRTAMARANRPTTDE